MKVNIGKLESLIRIIFGIMLLAWAIAGGPFWSFVGIFFIFTGSWKFCPFYEFWNKISKKSRF